MIDVIRYYTPYLVNDRNPLTLSFTFGGDISLESILDLRTTLAMGATINLQCGTLTSSKLYHTFSL